MREIKFRAWNEHSKSFQYINGVLDFKFWMPGYLDPQENKFPDNMQQYTGLKDKNGKEIYEGDILRVYFRDTESFYEMTVTYGLYENESNFGDGEGFIGWNIPVWTDYQPYKPILEVIGNIYENPELLKT